MTVGFVALLCAAPLTAQRRGTLEFGAFGSAAAFDNALSLNKGFGGGGRLGVYLTPRLSLEFEDAEMRGSRPNGLQTVNVGILSGRAVLVPVKTGALSLLLGAGAGVSTETSFMHSYGVDALAGAKIALNDNVALRVDGVFDWLANQSWMTYQSLRVGLSFYRHPREEIRTERTAVGPTVVRVDTVTLRSVRVDTVRVAPALPIGETATLCLATGEAVQVMVTAQGDTLIGPSRTSVRVLREGGVAFAGAYAAGHSWFDKDQSIRFDGRQFRKSDGEVRMTCPDLQKVGEFDGVPLFAKRDAKAPYQQIYAPIRPGAWQMFENLRRTRG